MRILFFIIILLFNAQSSIAAPCLLKEGQQAQDAKVAQVAQVIDGDTVTLDTGEHVRLVGIQAPKLPLGRKGFKAWPLGAEAKQALEGLVLGQKIHLKYGGRDKDRHGRLLAHIFVGDIWAQAEMIKSGMARVYSFSDNRACVEDLLRHETRARKADQGLWAHPFYRVRHAENYEKLSTEHNSFQLVRGKVLSTGEAKGKTYLNFGRNWKIDFTAVISKYNLRHFKKSKIDLGKLKDKTLIVRGWLGFHNGPKIDITHPEQVQIVAD